MASSQQSATGITPKRGLHILVWGWIKVVIRFIFGGRWLYMMWLKRSSEAEHEAQRKRNKAPSWLFDSHKTLERKLRRGAKAIHPASPRDVDQSGTSSDALSSHMSSSLISVEADSVDTVDVGAVADSFDVRQGVLRDHREAANEGVIGNTAKLVYR